MTGTIKTIVMGKPFGFISVEGEDKDIFFHEEKLVGVTLAELKPGDTLSFEVETSEKNGEMRKNAVNVQRA